MSQPELSKRLDEQFIALMLQVEQKYRVENNSKHHQLRVEQWVSSFPFFAKPKVQSSLRADPEHSMEKEPQFIRHDAAWSTFEWKTSETFLHGSAW